jgi:DNA-directed RNA polymerase subunit E'/Rpb7
VSLGFFEDVHVGSEMLLAPAQWQESAAEWLWTQDDSPPLYYQRGAKIRFRVHAVRFRGLPSLVEQAAQRERGEAVEGTEGRPHVPMAIEGRADAQGLGMVNWNWS